MKKRKFDRRHSIYYLRVFDTANQSLLGHLVNISEIGIMLVCDEEVNVNEEFTVRMMLPDQMGGADDVEFVVTSRWCKNDTNPNFFDVGFEMTKPDLDFLETLENLIDGFMFKELH